MTNVEFDILTMRPASRAFAARLVAALLAIVVVMPAMAQRGGTSEVGSSGIQQRLTDNAVRSPEQLDNVTVEDRLGNTVDGAITLTNSKGETVRMSNYFDGTKPVVLAMVYYNCPVVCPVTLQKLQKCFNEIEFTIGEDFRVVIVSFNDAETTPTAASIKEANLIGYDRGATPVVREGWTFHTATAGNAKALGDQVGFRFKKLPNGEFSHPVSTIFLTPEGKVSRYIHGFELPKRDVELALLEASDGTIAKDFGHFVATFCYRFDPASGSYALSAFRVMQIGGILTVLFLIILIGGLFAREHINKVHARRDRIRSDGATEASPRAATNVAATGSHP